MSGGGVVAGTSGLDLPAAAPGAVVTPAQHSAIIFTAYL
jgi:hypothetical protein